MMTFVIPRFLVISFSVINYVVSMSRPRVSVDNSFFCTCLYRNIVADLPWRTSKRWMFDKSLRFQYSHYACTHISRFRQNIRFSKGYYLAGQIFWPDSDLCLFMHNHPHNSPHITSGHRDGSLKMKSHRLQPILIFPVVSAVVFLVRVLRLRMSENSDNLKLSLPVL